MKVLSMDIVGIYMDFRELSHEEPPFEKHRRWISWVVDTLVILIMALFISSMFGEKVTVTGRSMEPELSQEEVVLINKMKYSFIPPERGDIICFRLEDESSYSDSQVYIKRIIGIPGETVQIKDGYVYINGEVLDMEDKLYQATVAGMAEDEIFLSDGEYFVLGDNRASSEDSRFSNIGMVKYSQIEGKVWFRISPFERIGTVK